MCKAKVRVVTTDSKKRVQHITCGSWYWRSDARRVQAICDRCLGVVKAHYKTYTEEKPLFGFIVGTIYCRKHHRKGEIT